MIICNKLEGKRDYALLDRKIVDPEVRLTVLLYRNKETVSVSKLIRNLWIHRKDLLRDQAKASGILGTEKLEIVLNNHMKENPRRENWYPITGSNLTIPRENSHRANLRVTTEINSGRDSRMKALAHSI